MILAEDAEVDDDDHGIAVFAVLGVLLVPTSPNRWGVGIALAAGIADHAWNVEQIVELPDGTNRLIA